MATKIDKDWPKIREIKELPGWYYVDSGTIDGKRVRVKRKGLEAAENEKANIRAKHAQIANQAAEIDTEDMQDSIEAMRILRGRVSLKEAAQFWAHHNVSDRSITVDGVRGEYMETKAKKRKRSRDEIRYEIDRFARFFGDREVHTVARLELRDYLKGRSTSAHVRDKTRRLLNAFFVYLVETDQLRDNPMPPKRKADTDANSDGETEPEIISIGEAQALMDAARQYAPEMVPYFTLALFCGIRPAEVPRIDWRDVDWEDKEIKVRKQVAKGNAARYVKIPDNAMLWLAPFQQATGTIFWSRRKWDLVREKSEVRWGNDCLRHTFGSCHLATYQDSGRTAEQMGHRNNTQMLFKHYRRAIKEREAAKLWQVVPAS